MILDRNVFSDPSIVRLFAGTAMIFGAEASASDDSLWIRGSGIKTTKRELTIAVEVEGFDQVIVSTTLIDENDGRSVYAVLGHVSKLESNSLVSLICWLIERILDGEGSSVRIYS